MSVHRCRQTPPVPTPPYDYHHRHHPHTTNTLTILQQSGKKTAPSTAYFSHLSPLAPSSSSYSSSYPSLPSLTVSNFNISPTTPPLLSGHFTVIISARNPNSKLTFSYNHLDAGIYLGSNQLSGTTLPPFALSKKNETSLTANFAAVGAYVDRAESENLVFNLKIQMKVRYKAGFWRRVTWLEAFCPGLSVRTNTAKSGSSSDVWSLIGGARSCEVC
nr:uncharacterized protein LOC113722184 [Coffea arabica]